MQGVLSEVASLCGCHPLALTLAAGAAKRAASLHDRPQPSVAEWQQVLDSLTPKLASQKRADYDFPLRAYAMSVDRLSEAGRSILSTLSIFPAVVRAPKDMIHAIWSAQQVPPDIGPPAQFQDCLDELVLSNVVDQHSEGDSALPSPTSK